VNKPISKRKNTPYGVFAVLQMGDVLSTVGGICCSIAEGWEDRTQRVGVSLRDVPPTLLPFILESGNEFPMNSWPTSENPVLGTWVNKGEKRAGAN
jgi:hypothetical protein